MTSEGLGGGDNYFGMKKGGLVMVPSLGSRAEFCALEREKWGGGSMMLPLLVFPASFSPGLVSKPPREHLSFLENESVPVHGKEAVCLVF